MATVVFGDRHDQAIRSDAARLVRRTLGDRRYGTLLFGSRARGEGGSDSDWDLAVLLAEAGDADQVRRSLRRAFADYAADRGIKIDVVVLDPELAQHSQPLLRNIDRDGVPL